MENSQFRELCLRLAQRLNDEKRFEEAGIIYAEYLDNGEECVSQLVQGKCWSEARRRIAKLNRPDLIGEFGSEKNCFCRL